MSRESVTQGMADRTFEAITQIWGRFSNWCSRRNLDQFKACVSEIVDFLLHLFDVEKLKVGTLANYRTSIARTLGPINQCDLGSHPVLCSLIANFTTRDPQ